ncbi:MAG TPA: DNA recombination protein RmuC [Terracidiphilus sp.]|nr:DNA recombination protein RmuC [Terracidiphilus sp.]
MTEAVIAVVALIVGVLLGFFLGGKPARAQKAAQEEKAREDAAALAAARAETAKAQEELKRTAGFEAVAAEREKSLARLREEQDTLRAENEAKSAAERTANARIKELEAELRNERQNLTEKVALLEEAKKTLTAQFQTLAQDILDQKSKTFSEGSQKEIGTLLNPLRTQIEDFRKKVEEAQTDSKTGVTKLETLVNALNSMNQQISEDARNLTTALRGSAKAQGDWGEFILRDLLDKAGLREGEQYTFQQSFGIASENGERARAVRTDVILSLPGGRSLVIDSKVSLTAYTEWAAAQDDDTRSRALKAHLTSVRAHMTGLSKAGYHKLPGVEAPDFVVMFVPVEPAFLLALQNDPDLWADAYQQGILLVGPTTLLYVIRIVNVLWQQEKQARNVRDVMERGADLYDKFVGFVTDMEAIGDSLRRTDASYANAMKKLSEGRGNLVRQVEMLKKLGLQTTKSLPKSLVDRADVEEGTLYTLAAGAEGNDNGGTGE